MNTATGFSNTQNPEIIAALAGEKMDGFEKLYQLHYRRVYSICIRMTGNEAEAKDLTQEVFLQVHRKLSTFKGASAFTTWLHRVTVNQVLMHFRKRSVKDVATTSEEELNELIESGKCLRPLPVDIEEVIVDRVTIATALKQLPPGYRTAFILHDVEGYEHEEIARILGCSPGTSKSQLHKARLKLRRLLAQETAH